MKIIKTAFVAALLFTSGCASITPERAAVATGAIIITSVAISASHGHRREPLSISTPAGLPCYPQPNGTCR